jgi:hypothetical protein
MTQEQALDILKTGANVFLTGPAGSGKTHVVNRYVGYLRSNDVEVGIAASTGIAATHLGGVTIHAWSGMGIKNHLTERDLEQLATRGNLARRFERTKVLVIDEVSMLHHFRLDLLDTIAKKMRNDPRPFGGMQVVLVGDFFQLPPVTRRDEPAAKFVYESKAWKAAGFEVCYLEEQYRQTDDAALAILNEIRAGEVSEGSREMLRTRFKGGAPTYDDQASPNYDAYAEFGEYAEATISLDVPAVEDEDVDGVGGIEFDEDETQTPKRVFTLSENGIEPTRIFTHNADVDEINESALCTIGGNCTEYAMVGRGRDVLVEALKKSCLAPEVLRIKPGARVMCVKNDFEKGYVNGSLGIVESCSQFEDPVVRLADGSSVVIERATWRIEEEGTVKAEITQYPLRLAWAITVHKSQGMSLDAIEVDLSRSFTPGMGYVALSRVRTLDGLTILGINETAFQVSPEVLEFDSELRMASHESVERLEATGAEGVKAFQEAFLLRSRSMGKAPKVRTHQETLTLLQEGKTLDEMAAARKLTAETIISHLETLQAEGVEMSVAYLSAEIPKPKYKKIAQALAKVVEETGQARLTPIKMKLDDTVSFREIRLVRLIENPKTVS